MTGAACGAGNAYPSGAPDFTFGVAIRSATWHSETQMIGRPNRPSGTIRVNETLKLGHSEENNPSHENLASYMTSCHYLTIVTSCLV